MIQPDSEEKAVRRRCRGEDGVFTPWFLVLVVPMMMMMAGLVFDGGHVLAERRDALDLAQNAARAGIQGIDSAQVRQGSPTIDPDRARAAVTDYLNAAGFTGTIEVTVTATEVSVVLSQDVEMQLLSAVGVDDKTVTGRATARIVRGVEGADT